MASPLFAGIDEVRVFRLASPVQMYSLKNLVVLDALEEVKVGVGYEIDGKRMDSFPGVSSELRSIKPILLLLISLTELNPRL